MIKINNPPLFLEIPNRPPVKGCDTIWVAPMLTFDAQIVLQFGNWIEPEPTIEPNEEGEEIEVTHKPYFEAKSDYVYKTEIRINAENFAIATHEEAIEKIKKFAPDLELEIFGL